MSPLIPCRDYVGLNEQNAQLRMWLPEPAKLALEQVAEVEGISMTGYLIEFFTTYLYGKHELLRMRASRIGIYEPSKTKKSMMGVRQEEAPSLGKNIFALKIFLPEKLKAGLANLALEAGMTLGEFSRGLVCAHLFGREFGSVILADACKVDSAPAAEWERDKFL